MSEAVGEADLPPQPSERAVSPLSEGEDEEGEERPRVPSPLPNEATTEVEVGDRRDVGHGQEDTAAAGSGSGSGSGEGPSAVASTPEVAIRTRTASTSSTSAAAPLPPIPAIATRPSPIPSPSPTEHAVPPEVVLPRWQPDSEVTYCPICGTQFSIFVRKHHCRYVPETRWRWRRTATDTEQQMRPRGLQLLLATPHHDTASIHRTTPRHAPSPHPRAVALPPRQPRLVSRVWRRRAGPPVQPVRARPQRGAAPDTPGGAAQVANRPCPGRQHSGQPMGLLLWCRRCQRRADY